MFPTVSFDDLVRRTIAYGMLTPARPGAIAPAAPPLLAVIRFGELALKVRPPRTGQTFSANAGGAGGRAGARLGWLPDLEGLMYIPAHFAPDEALVSELLANHG